MISREDQARLAELYDRYQNSLRPLDPDRLQAGRDFSLEPFHKSCSVASV